MRGSGAPCGSASASLSRSSNSPFRAMIWPATVNNRNPTGLSSIRASQRGPSPRRRQGYCRSLLR
ncbi:hypothetical protein HU200_004290 [Digitaria exilis]|uniref:Uncharacterized protein n=1 Tax=Digitaria exilis TaxID=1010633 RepID=A0A835KSG0_9POAL|nr:hypothetical protein HU200_004290 [Digitaria exilis]